MTDTNYDGAQWYLRLGWSVFPCEFGTKKPSIKWAPMQRKRASPETIRSWFAEVRNIAIVCGDVSGGLVVRDFDTVEAYRSWCAQHRDLAERLPTVQTSRGFHVYCRMEPCPKLESSAVADGEFRGAGAMVLAPPSLHPSGAIYEWIIEPGEELPFLTLRDLDLEHLERNELSGEVIQSQRSQHSHQSQPSQEKPMDAVRSESDVCNAVAASVPSGPGQRNNCIFDLARRVIGIFGKDANEKTLTGIFDQWWEMAEPNVATKDYTLSLYEFFRAYENATTAFGSRMQTFLDQAVKAERPKWIPEKCDDRCKVLGSLCRELQRANGGCAFFLSTHTAGELFGTTPMQCWRWLKVLEGLGGIELVAKGQRGGGKAARYRYIADDL